MHDASDEAVHGHSTRLRGSDHLPRCGRAVEGGGSDAGAAQALALSALVPAAVSLLVYALQPASAEGEPQVLHFRCLGIVYISKGEHVLLAIAFVHGTALC